MNSNQTYIDEWSYPSDWTTQAQTWRKILPLEWAVKKKISKLNLSLDYNWRLNRDKSWLEIEDEIIPKRKKKQPKYHISDEQKLFFEEMTENIVNDHTLSQTYGNPTWYKPIPVYTPPHGTSWTVEQIRAFKKRKEEKNTSIQSATVFVSEDFWDAWVFSSDRSITIEELYKYHEASNGLINPKNIYHHVVPMTVTEGTLNHTMYAYPNLVERVRWHVSYCCSEKWNELLWVYCYKNKKAIDEVTWFLAENPVLNIEDQNAAILSLSKISHIIP